MDLEAFDFVIEHIKGLDNGADALSRIDIKDLFNVYEENHIFKINVEPIVHKKNTHTQTKTERMREANQVLAFTRSMARSKNSHPIQDNPSELDKIQISENTQKVFESFSQQKTNPRVRITNCKLNDSGIPLLITLCAFQNHRKIFELKFGLDNEKVTLNIFLSKLQCEASAMNIKLIEWPLHDIIFKMCTINKFKAASNDILTDLQINLVKSPIIVENVEERENILKKFHCDELFGGHSVKKNVFAKIKDHYHWRNMSRDIAKFVSNCHTCKLSQPNKKTKEELELTVTPCKPFDIVQIDTIGPLMTSNNGNQYAITIIDEMSKWLVIIPSAGKSA